MYFHFLNEEFLFVKVVDKNLFKNMDIREVIYKKF